MAITENMEYVNVPGGFTNLQTYDGGGSEIPLLYIHGGPGGNCESFKPMARRLAEKRKVYLYNQLGSDDTSSTGEESLWIPERYVEALGIIIKHIGAPKLHLLGRSWGALLAAEHVLANPDSPAVSITMMSPYLSTEIWIRDARTRLAEMGPEAVRAVEDGESSDHFDEKAFKDVISAYNMRYQCREMDAWSGDTRLRRAVRPKTATGMKVYRHMWGPGEFACTGIMKDIDITARLPEIKLRVMFLLGEYDQVLPTTCEYYRSLIPGSRIAVIPGASQTQFIENEDIFFSVITQFLNGF